mmetsp:Transcript_27282/g.54568  ORF Transcript_27282/g.54568 Transcript_27282/m.54568 type:complete len:201 (+) Transcript_27282:227-829(+)
MQNSKNRCSNWKKNRFSCSDVVERMSVERSRSWSVSEHPQPGTRNFRNRCPRLTRSRPNCLAPAMWTAAAKAMFPRWNVWETIASISSNLRRRTWTPGGGGTSPRTPTRRPPAPQIHPLRRPSPTSRRSGGHRSRAWWTSRRKVPVPSGPPRPAPPSASPPKSSPNSACRRTVARPTGPRDRSSPPRVSRASWPPNARQN